MPKLTPSFKTHIFKNAQEQFEEFTALLLEEPTQSMNLDDVEYLIKDKGRELQRTLLEEQIASRGTGDVGAVLKGEDGIERTYKRMSVRKILTIFGEVKITRIGYYRPGIACFFPMDTQLNLPDCSYSYLLQKMIVLEAIKSSFDEVVETLYRITGIRVSKRTCEEIVLGASRYFHEYYQDKSHDHHDREEGGILVMTIDGKGISMRKGSLRCATKKKANENNRSTKQRLSPGEKKHSKRMAAVASTYCIQSFKRTVDEVIQAMFVENFSYRNKRPRPTRKRVWASVEKTFEETVEELFQESKKRDPKNQLDWVALVDGDSKQIIYLKKYAEEENIDLVIICDFIHVLEYLWKAAHVFFEGLEEKEKWVKERLERVLSGKAVSVASSLRRSATRQGITGNEREVIDKCSSYLKNLSPYLNYNEYLEKGYPIATGIIEGACRYVVQDRMGKTGARWGLEGAEAILKLRSLKASHEFDVYWNYYQNREFSRNYGSFQTDQIMNILIKNQLL